MDSAYLLSSSTVMANIFSGGAGSAFISWEVRRVAEDVEAWGEVDAWRGKSFLSMSGVSVPDIELTKSVSSSLVKVTFGDRVNS